MSFCLAVVAFPPDFWWGTTIAAHQAEGGNVNTWSQWEDAGHAKDHQLSGRATDHWNLYEEDFDRAVWLGSNTLRMSIEWSRLEPRPGEWNVEAEAHYRKMFEALKKRGIRPVVCLFHFSLPIWVGDAGGFENQKMVEAFVRFSAHVESSYHDLVSDWLTMNEPNIYALTGYVAGVTPPGVKDYTRAARVMANLIRMHGLTYQILKKQNPASRVSFAMHLRRLGPSKWYSPLDQIAAYYGDTFFNWAWMDVIHTGQIELKAPLLVHIVEPCPECKGALDYVGFNYYGRDMISIHPFSDEPIRLTVKPGNDTTDLGWEIFPQGLREILVELKNHGFANLPMLITENGIADVNDTKRADFIYQHLKTFFETSEELGLKPMGYLHWTLMDNFEWLEGQYARFGLFAVDYKTMARTPRASAVYFSALGKSKSLFPPDELPAHVPKK